MGETEAKEYIRYRLRVKYGSLTNCAKARGITVAAVSKGLMPGKTIPRWMMDEASLTRTVTYHALDIQRDEAGMPMLAIAVDQEG